MNIVALMILPFPLSQIFLPQAQWDKNLAWQGLSKNTPHHFQARIAREDRVKVAS